MTQYRLNLVQNSSKANPKQRSLTDFLGLVDQLFQFPSHSPVARAYSKSQYAEIVGMRLIYRSDHSALDPPHSVIFIQAQFGQRFRLTRCNLAALAGV